LTISSNNIVWTSTRTYSSTQHGHGKRQPATPVSRIPKKQMYTPQCQGHQIQHQINKEKEKNISLYSPSVVQEEVLFSTSLLQQYGNELPNKIREARKMLTTDEATSLSLDTLLEILSTSPNTLSLTLPQLDHLWNLIFQSLPSGFTLTTNHYDAYLSHLVNRIDLDHPEKTDESIPKRALDCFTQMKQFNLIPSIKTYSLLITAYGSIPSQAFSIYSLLQKKDSKMIHQLHSNALKTLLLLSLNYYPNITHSYIWSLYTALKKSGTEPSIKIFEIMLITFSKMRDMEGVISTYTKMTAVHGFSPWSRETYERALESFARLGNEKRALRVLGTMQQHGYSSN